MLSSDLACSTGTGTSGSLALQGHKLLVAISLTENPTKLALQRPASESICTHLAEVEGHYAVVIIEQDVYGI